MAQKQVICFALVLLAFSTCLGSEDVSSKSDKLLERIVALLTRDQEDMDTRGVAPDCTQKVMDVQIQCSSQYNAKSTGGLEYCEWSKLTNIGFMGCFYQGWYKAFDTVGAKCTQEFTNAKEMMVKYYNHRMKTHGCPESAM
ncbi:uncharacterized protein LOC106155161 [Lingula anatina]|uniref:Uncharacterized protein LOC106155161 n=1 Tax=Lingula anatina TaxID=7574 RepID=A0A1S3HGV1_LINAN|nr:uncharacterized protein LOC106155161 [Lingula anatina]XP_013385300.1 uncharacterized protein LOC106155161 [Lingula anatina]|eukprot:XP_013385299.1 uncharacterized protein LOC106155161 [Lingula anatina]